MKNSVNPRIIKTIKELSEEEIVSEFLISILLEEARNSGKDKQFWQYKEYYRKKVEEYASKK